MTLSVPTSLRTEAAAALAGGFFAGLLAGGAAAVTLTVTGATPGLAALLVPAVAGIAGAVGWFAYGGLPAMLVHAAYERRGRARLGMVAAFALGGPGYATIAQIGPLLRGEPAWSNLLVTAAMGLTAVGFALWARRRMAAGDAA